MVVTYLKSVVPPEWLTGVLDRSAVAAGSTLDTLPCSSYKELHTAWRKAMRWTDGLDTALSVMLASIMSTECIGDQLWVKIIGPASCGKSTLCEAVSTNLDYVLPKSTIRGFHTGYKDPSGEDHSLIAKVAGKTLVTKDGDTLIQSPNLGQILSEARDVYDRTSRTHYRNSQSKDYANISMTWVLCGTNSLAAIDESELGERFLDCVIMHGIDDELEDEILIRKAHQTKRYMHRRANHKPETQYAPELIEAMRLTGGYVTWLRQNAEELLSSVAQTDDSIWLCTRLAKFTAHMRAQPSVRQSKSVEREFAPRLVGQITMLANCLAAVLNRGEVDAEVMRRVHKVAMDTSRGQSLIIAGTLFKSPEGQTPSSIALYCNSTEDKTRTLLRFLKQIGVVELSTIKAANGARTGQTRYVLTERFRQIYQEVHRA